MKNDTSIILKVNNLSKKYINDSNDITVFENIDFSINEGEIVSLMGPSGIGKSTLLNILGTLTKPDTGNIIYDNVDPFTLSDKKLAKFRNEKIGFVFQFHHLLPEFSALENVYMPSIIYKPFTNKIKNEALEILKSVGLEHRINHRPSELSGGERQRVAIARAMINNPKVILADEPSGNLDVDNSQKLVDLLLELSQISKRTFIIATHNPSIAKRTDRILYMDGKKITSTPKNN